MNRLPKKEAIVVRMRRIALGFFGQEFSAADDGFVHNASQGSEEKDIWNICQKKWTRSVQLSVKESLQPQVVVAAVLHCHADESARQFPRR